MIFPTIIGDVGRTKTGSGEDYREIAQEFLNRNPSWKYIQFHIHSKGTIRTYGNYYSENFSSEDLKIINKHEQDNLDYMHLLITPSRKILHGSDNPQLLEVTSFIGYEQVKQEAIKELGQILQEKGIKKLIFNLKK